MDIVSKKIKILTDSEKISADIVMVGDPNFPMTDQAAKDILLALHYLKSVLNKTISDQDFKSEDMTDNGRKSYKMLGGDK